MTTEEKEEEENGLRSQVRVIVLAELEDKEKKVYSRVYLKHGKKTLRCDFNEYTHGYDSLGQAVLKSIINGKCELYKLVDEKVLKHIQLEDYSGWPGYIDVDSQVRRL